MPSAGAGEQLQDIGCGGCILRAHQCPDGHHLQLCRRTCALRGGRDYGRGHHHDSQPGDIELGGQGADTQQYLVVIQPVHQTGGS